MRLATNCANAYRLADHQIKRQFNEAVFEKIVVRDGHVGEARYQAPFGPFFPPEFEHSGLERETGVKAAGTTNSAVDVRYRLVE
jgi:hypothetical protein